VTANTRDLEEAEKLMEARCYAEALTEYRRAVAAAEDDPRAQIGLGVCLMKLRHWDQAISALTRGIELRPAYAEADARLFLAESLLAAGQKRKAIEQWKIVEGMPSTYPSHQRPMDEARPQLALHGGR
jgi:Flp pilus assembly protein TadD